MTGRDGQRTLEAGGVELFIVLALYSVATLHAIRLSHGATVTLGIVAGMGALIANVAGIVFGGGVRAAAAPIVLVLAAFGARQAFQGADNSRRDSDEERGLSKAGMALVGLAIGEALIIALFGLLLALFAD